MQYTQFHVANTTTDHSLWEDTVAQFREHYHMISIVTPDMELSKGLRQKWGYRPAEIHQIIDTFLNKHLGPTRQFDLLMHDWGCLWGFKYIEKNPSRVRKTVAVGSWIVAMIGSIIVINFLPIRAWEKCSIESKCVCACTCSVCTGFAGWVDS